MTSTSSPAVTSAQARLAKGVRFKDFSDERLLETILHWEIGKNPCDFVAGRLGPRTSTVMFEGGEWSVWTNEDYILYIQSNGTAIDLDVTAIGLESGIKALRLDLKMGDYPLPRAEHKALFAKGRAVGVTVKYPIPNTTTEELREFVRAYCDGRILCDHQVRDQNLLGVVFIPLALGAFSINEPKKGESPSPEYLAEKSICKPLPPEPKLSTHPPAPVKPAYPPEPPKPSGWKEPDPEQVKVIEYDIECGVAPSNRLSHYLEVIELHNHELRFHYQEALDAWEAVKVAVDTKHQEALDSWEKACKTVDAQNGRLKARLTRWQKAKLRRDALYQGFHAGRMEDLGCIYEDYSQAGPRSVNGYPCFFSFRTLSRSDWDRARKAIIKELEHRESMEV